MFFDPEDEELNFRESSPDAATNEDDFCQNGKKCFEVEQCSNEGKESFRVSRLENYIYFNSSFLTTSDRKFEIRLVTLMHDVNSL